MKYIELNKHSLLLTFSYENSKSYLSYTASASFLCKSLLFSAFRVMSCINTTSALCQQRQEREEKAHFMSAVSRKYLKFFISFIFDCAGSSLRCMAFSTCVEQGLLSGFGNTGLSGCSTHA